MIPNKESEEAMTHNNNSNKGYIAMKEVIKMVLNNNMEIMTQNRRSTRLKLSRNIDNGIASRFGAKVLKNLIDTYTKGIERTNLLH